MPWSVRLLLVVAAVLTSAPVRAQSVEFVHDFTPPARNPYAGLVQATDNFFYGTTLQGGAYDLGTIFRMDDTGAVTLLYSFDGPTGAWPRGALVQGDDGLLYGTTEKGGVSNAGTIYRLESAGRVTVLHSFTSGSRPYAALVKASDGRFYGTNAGTGGCGSVFRFDVAGSFATLHAFNVFSPTTGCQPFAKLIEGNDGLLYGATVSGGAYGKGTIFRLTTAGVVSVMHSFDGTTGNGTFAPLVQGNDGYFYGGAGGGAFNRGTLFKMDAAGSMTLLHTFTTSEQGAYLAGGMVEGPDGYFYGTTQSGSLAPYGTVFKMDAAGGVTFLHALGLSSQTGSTPYGGLIRGTDGLFYVTAHQGGSFGSGTVLRVDADGDATVLHAFNSMGDGALRSPLIRTSDGVLMGTLEGRGIGFGGPAGIFTYDGSTVSTTTELFDANEDVVSAAGPLLQVASGAIYGVSPIGGEFSEGLIFRLENPTTVTVVSSFDYATSGSSPLTGLVEGSGGLLYGTTLGGGAFEGGTVFRFEETGGLQGLYGFGNDDGLPQPDGRYPASALVQGSDGKFYGVTHSGGSSFRGTVFRMDQTGAVNIIHSFVDGPFDHFPVSALIEGVPGLFFGTRAAGGAFGKGIVYRIDSLGAFTVLHSFNGANGEAPAAALYKASDGYLYGTTARGGAYGYGTLFRVTPAGALTVVYSFDGADGSGPAASVIELPDGYLYGTTVSGGANAGGTLYRYPIYNTPAGADTDVEPVDTTTGMTPVEVIFSEVLTSGNTALTTSDNGPAIPAGFQLGTPATFYELTTTSTFSGTITVCVSYDETAYEDESSLTLHHFEGGAWVDVTTSVDTAANVACGSVTSLSPFAVLAPASPTDAEPPVISCAAADGLWHGGDVLLSCVASDSGSGLANTGDAAFSLTASVAAGQESIDAATGSREVCDNAGNCAVAGPIGGNKIDRKAPQIAIHSPLSGATFRLNQAAVADYACTDSGSGTASCNDSATDGGAIETATIGARTFSVTAVDLVGNTATQAASYSVSYDVCLLYDASKAYKHGSTLPLKIQLCDANGANVSASGTVVNALGVTFNSNSAPGMLEDSGNANPDFNFRFDPSLGSGGGYIFNLSLKGFETGTYALSFSAGGDPAPHSIAFQVK